MSLNSDSRLPPPVPRSTASVHPGLIGILGVLVAFLLFKMLNEQGVFSEPVGSRVVTPRGDLADDEQTTVEIYRNIRDSVVFIETRGDAQLKFDLRVNVWREEVPEGVGSGIVWDDRGHVITNLHVIQFARAATVRLTDGSEWNARLVEIYPAHDLAVLRIDAPRGKLKPIPLGTSSDLQVGQTVFALGFPFGLNLTLTKGIISGQGGTIPLDHGAQIEDAIQTDAAINPGNSGGPLLDSAGRLIGINTAILSPSNASAGVGFAIPVDVLRRDVALLLETTPYRDRNLGIDFWPELVEWRNPRTGEVAYTGIEILHLIEEGLAQQGRLRGATRDAAGHYFRGDLIIACNGEPITDPQQFIAILEKLRSGDEITLRVVRQGVPGDFSARIP